MTTDGASAPSVLIIAMGTSGSGKSTLGERVAQHLKLPFVDGDDVHPPANRAKMASGTPLDDQDRLPWLKAVRRTGAQLVRPDALPRLLERHVEPAHAQAASGDKDAVSRAAGVLAQPTVATAAEPAPDAKDDDMLKAAIALVTPGSLAALESGSGTIKRANGEQARACIIACSALKRSYRDVLRGSQDGEEAAGLQTYFLYLRGSHALLLKRMSGRAGHFFKAPMLDSQFAALEEPDVELEPRVAIVQQARDDEHHDEEAGVEEVVRRSIAAIDALVRRRV